MPIKDVCSPNSSGQKPKPTPLPGANKDRGVKHTAPYGPPTNDKRADQSNQPPIGPSLSSSTPRVRDRAEAPAELPETSSIDHGWPSSDDRGARPPVRHPGSHRVAGGAFLIDGGA